MPTHEELIRIPDKISKSVLSQLRQMQGKSVAGALFAKANPLPMQPEDRRFLVGWHTPETFPKPIIVFDEASHITPTFGGQPRLGKPMKTHEGLEQFTKKPLAATLPSAGPMPTIQTFGLSIILSQLEDRWLEECTSHGICKSSPLGRITQSQTWSGLIVPRRDLFKEIYLENLHLNSEALFKKMYLGDWKIDP